MNPPQDLFLANKCMKKGSHSFIHASSRAYMHIAPDYENVSKTNGSICAVMQLTLLFPYNKQSATNTLAVVSKSSTKL